jgi:hypothetical protein
MELAPASPAEKWATAQRAIAMCAKLDLTVWYAFGSARLTLEPQEQQCRMTVMIEGEMAEAGRHKGFTCLGTPEVFKDLDLAHDGQALRQGPPEELPETLKPLCTPISTN